MKTIRQYYWALMCCLLLGGATTGHSQTREEAIIRKQGERSAHLQKPTLQPPPNYPWDHGMVGKNPKITKEFFRCKGSQLNSVRRVERGEQVDYYHDCAGREKHSLPQRDGQEFVYPILIDLLNYIQAKTGNRVVITSGHRCPEHNTYLDPSPSNNSSKHMIAAEVSFYVQNMEYKPEEIVQLMMSYYQETPKYEGKSEYINFQRYTKDNTGVVTQPWFNKEIYFKLYKENEGRDLDNRHPYPYLSLQVLLDLDTMQKVRYNQDDAYRSLLRW